MEDIKMIFADNLNYYMKLNGMSQKELAERLNTSTSSVSNWCNGSNTPRMDIVGKLTKLFGCSNSDLLERKVKAAAIPVKASDFSHLIAFKTADMTAEQIEAIKNLIITLGGEIV